MCLNMAGSLVTILSGEIRTGEPVVITAIVNIQMPVSLGGSTTHHISQWPLRNQGTFDLRMSSRTATIRKWRRETGL